MQVHIETRQYDATGIKGERDFTVAFGPHIMQVLSGLYSDIHWSIVREYGTNMYDGYVRKMLDDGLTKEQLRPAVLHLPNAIEPWLEFKDFGCGMCVEDVWKYVTGYGESSKQGNNDEVGGLGLGCKAAFCYREGDQWTFESRYGGEQHFFFVARGTTGIPKLLHADSLPTLEPSGVTVRINVLEADFQPFRTAAEKFCRYYPLPIEVVGVTDFHAPKPVYSIEGTGWGLQTVVKGESEGPLILMGNVPYPLSQSECQKLEAVDGWKVNRKVPLDLRLPIGSADVTPSREALKWTPRTQAAIAKHLALVLKELPEKFAQLVEAAPTRWAAMRLVNELPLERPPITSVQWKGQSLNPITGIVLSLDALKAVDKDATIQLLSDGYRRGKKHVECSSIDEVRLQPGTRRTVVLGDLSTSQNVARSRYDLRQRLVAWTNAYSGTRGPEPGSVFLVSGKGLTRAQLEDLLGGFPVRAASALDEVPKDYSGGGTGIRRKVAVRIFNRQSSMDYWEDGEVDIAAGGYYLQMEGGKSMTIGEWGARSLLEYLDTLGIFSADTPLYGIPRTLKRIEGKPGWVSFYPWAKERVEKLVRAEKDDFEEAHRWEKVLGVQFVLDLWHLLPEERLPAGSPLRALFEALGRAREAQKRLATLRAAACHFNLSSVLDAKNIEQPGHWEALEPALKRYPLLNLIGDIENAGGWVQWRQVKSFQKMLLEHIESVEQSLAQPAAFDALEELVAFV